MTQSCLVPGPFQMEVRPVARGHPCQARGTPFSARQWAPLRTGYAMNATPPAVRHVLNWSSMKKNEKTTLQVISDVIYEEHYCARDEICMQV